MNKLTGRIIELSFGIASIGSFALWLNYGFQNQKLSPSLMFLSPYFFIFVGVLIFFTVFHLKNWKSTIDNAEKVIFEIVVYRKMTPINSLAKKLAISKDEVFEILQKMIIKNRIVGHIKDGIYYSHSPRTPICPICNEEITDSLRLIVCPFCRKPFHKDHIMGYIKDVQERCPNCKNILTLGDLFLE